MTRRTAIFLAVAALVCAAAAGADDAGKKAEAPAKPFAERMVEADAFLKAENFEDAAALYEAMVDEVPADSSLYMGVLRGLRRAYDGSWEGRKFVAVMKKVLAGLDRLKLGEEPLKELRFKYLMLLATYHDDHREALGAIEAYEELVRLCKPVDEKSLKYKLARLYEEAGHAGRALAIFKERAEESPGNRYARMQLARAYFKVGKVEEGLAAVGPDAEPSQVRQMVRELYLAKCLPAAERLARSILETDRDARRLLAEICSEQKNFEEAKKHFFDCLLRVEGGEEADATRFTLAELLAKVHVNCGSSIEEAELLQQKLKGPAEDEEAGELRRVTMIQLIELKKESGDHAGALSDFLKYRQGLAKKTGQDWRLTEIAIPALRQLVSETRLDYAALMLKKVKDLEVSGMWVDCVEYMLEVRAKQEDKANTLLDVMEITAGENENKIFSLADEMSEWGQEEVATRLYRKLLKAKPDHSVYDMNAHARLAQYYCRKEGFVESKRHFELLNAGLSARNVGIVGEESMRELEAYVRYKAAGDDPDELVRLLEDPHPLRRLAAAHLLGRYGRREDLKRMEEAARAAAPKLRAALKEAATTIASRGALDDAKPEKVTGNNLRTLAESRGKVLWIETDPFEKEWRWVAVEKQFVALADLKTGVLSEFDEPVGILVDELLTASAIAFTSNAVWVGTDRGLFAFERRTGTWSTYAVNRVHIGAPVKALSVEKGLVRVTISVEKKDASFTFDPASGSWQ